MAPMAAAKTSIVPKKSVAPKKSVVPKKSVAPTKPMAPKKSVAPTRPMAPKKSVAPKISPPGPGVCICGAPGKTLLAKVISQVNPEGTIAIAPRAFEVQFCPSCTTRIRSSKELSL
jgi:hypothetical protein